MIRAGVARLSPRCSLQFNLNLRARRAVTCKPYHKRNSCSAPCLGRPAAVVAIDVEYAHFLVNGQVKTAAAEVCVVKEDNSVLLESFICPGLSKEACARWFGGVKPENFEAGCTLHDTGRSIEHGVTGCLLLGYGLSKDLHALQMHHPENMQKDLMHSPKFQSGRAAQARKLQDIALEFLGSNIQSSKHSAREDAQAIMQVYLKHIKNDLSEMTYAELVQLETEQLMKRIAEST